MARGPVRSLWCAAGLMTAFWPVWVWQISRYTDGSDEPFGLIALVTLLLLALFRPSTGILDFHSLIGPSLMVVLYIATYPYLSKLPQAVIAVTALGAVVSRVRFDSFLHLAPWGLLLLSLPVISSLQFYLGYPMRVVAGTISVFLLQMGGLAVERAGACLQWGGKLVVIDAPCSGVRMLWVGMYLTLTLACLLKLSEVRTLIAAVLCLFLIILGNAFRAMALFQIEVGFPAVPSWSHDAVGLTIFMLTSLLIIWIVNSIGKGKRCERPACS